MHDHTSKPAGTLHSYQTKATLTSNIGTVQHDERTRSHKKKPARTKTNSTLLLKLLAAFCVLDCVGATEVPTMSLALATASEAVATSASPASRPANEICPLGFSFTPGGLLFPYYVGAAYELQRLGLLTPNAPLGGSSAGAIVATAVASGLTEAEILDGLSVLVADYRGGTSLRASLRKQLARLLPDDAPQRCERHGLTVCYR